MSSGTKKPNRESRASTKRSSKVGNVASSANGGSKERRASAAASDAPRKSTVAKENDDPPKVSPLASLPEDKQEKGERDCWPSLCQPTRNIGRGVVPTLGQRLGFFYENATESMAKSNNSFGFLSTKNPIRKAALQLTDNVWFDRVVLLLIAGNCVCLAIDTPGEEVHTPKKKALEKAELFFTFVFTAELLVQVTAKCFFFGPKAYMGSTWNWLDFVCVITSYSFVMGGGNISGLRAFRALRPLRTISGVPGMRLLVNTLLNSLPLLFDVFVLIAWMFFVFGILGMQLFMGKLSSRCHHVLDDGSVGAMIDGEEDDPCGARDCGAEAVCVDGYGNPRMGFVSYDNFLWACINILISLTLQGWTTDEMYLLQDGAGAVAVAFHVALVLFGSFFALSLLTAIISAKFAQMHSQYTDSLDPEKQEELIAMPEISEEESSFVKWQKQTLAAAITWYRKAKQPVTGWRVHFAKITDADKFNSFVTLCIVINIVMMAMEHHNMDSGLKSGLEVMNTVLSIIFAVEFVLKLLGLGIVVYWSSAFNAMDGIIVVFSMVEFGLGGSNSGLSALRSFRLLRVMRSMKLLRQHAALRRLTKLVLQGFLALKDFVMLLFLFLFIFAILGMQMFGGQEQFQPDNTPLYRKNFDNLWSSLLTVFELLTGANWLYVMWNGMLAIGNGASMYFVAWIVAGHYILLTLFLAILITNFQEVQEREDEADEGITAEDKKHQNRAETEKKRKLNIIQQRINNVMNSDVMVDTHIMKWWLVSVDEAYGVEDAKSYKVNFETFCKKFLKPGSRLPNNFFADSSTQEKLKNHVILTALNKDKGSDGDGKGAKKKRESKARPAQPLSPEQNRETLERPVLDMDMLDRQNGTRVKSPEPKRTPEPLHNGETSEAESAVSGPEDSAIDLAANADPPSGGEFSSPAHSRQRENAGSKRGSFQDGANGMLEESMEGDESNTSIGDATPAHQNGHANNPMYSDDTPGTGSAPVIPMLATPLSVAPLTLPDGAAGETPTPSAQPPPAGPLTVPGHHSNNMTHYPSAPPPSAPGPASHSGSHPPQYSQQPTSAPVVARGPAPDKARLLQPIGGPQAVTPPIGAWRGDSPQRDANPPPPPQAVPPPAGMSPPGTSPQVPGALEREPSSTSKAVGPAPPVIPPFQPPPMGMTLSGHSAQPDPAPQYQEGVYSSQSVLELPAQPPMVSPRAALGSVSATNTPREMTSESAGPSGAASGAGPVASRGLRSDPSSGIQDGVPRSPLGTPNRTPRSSDAALANYPPLSPTHAYGDPGEKPHARAQRMSMPPQGYYQAMPRSGSGNDSSAQFANLGPPQQQTNSYQQQPAASSGPQQQAPAGAAQGPPQQHSQYQPTSAAPNGPIHLDGYAQNKQPPQSKGPPSAYPGTHNQRAPGPGLQRAASAGRARSQFIPNTSGGFQGAPNGHGPHAQGPRPNSAAPNGPWPSANAVPGLQAGRPTSAHPTGPTHTQPGRPTSAHPTGPTHPQQGRPTSAHPAAHPARSSNNRSPRATPQPSEGGGPTAHQSYQPSFQPNINPPPNSNAQPGGGAAPFQFKPITPRTRHQSVYAPSSQYSYDQGPGPGPGPNHGPRPGPGPNQGPGPGPGPNQGSRPGPGPNQGPGPGPGPNHGMGPGTNPLQAPYLAQVPQQQYGHRPGPGGRAQSVFVPQGSGGVDAYLGNKAGGGPPMQYTAQPPGPGGGPPPNRNSVYVAGRRQSNFAASSSFTGISAATGQPLTEGARDPESGAGPRPIAGLRGRELLEAGGAAMIGAMRDVKMDGASPRGTQPPRLEPLLGDSSAGLPSLSELIAQEDVEHLTAGKEGDLPPLGLYDPSVWGPGEGLKIDSVRERGGWVGGSGPLSSAAASSAAADTTPMSPRSPREWLQTASGQMRTWLQRFPADVLSGVRMFNVLARSGRGGSNAVLPPSPLQPSDRAGTSSGAEDSAGEYRSYEEQFGYVSRKAEAGVGPSAMVRFGEQEMSRDGDEDSGEEDEGVTGGGQAVMEVAKVGAKARKVRKSKMEENEMSSMSMEASAMSVKDILNGTDHYKSESLIGLEKSLISITQIMETKEMTDEELAQMEMIRRRTASRRDLISRKAELAARRQEALDKVEELKNSALDQEVTYRALLCLPSDHPIRRIATRTTTNAKFEWFILVLIITSSILLALDRPGLQPDSPTKVFLTQADIAFTAVFTLEMVLKIVAQGLALHPGSYLRSGWNLVDCVIVISALVSVMLNDDSLSVMRGLRLLRTLRPLRMISRLKGLQLVVTALIRSLPAVLNVVMFGVFEVGVFGILGVQLFGGKFYSCNDTDMATKAECVGSFVCQSHSRDCVLGAITVRAWENEYLNFDHLGEAAKTLFVVATLDDWMRVTYSCIDSVDVDMQPVENNNPINALYVLAFVFLGSFFWVNLLVGVIIDNYMQVIAELGEGALLTSEQKKWMHALQLKDIQTLQADMANLPKNPVRRACFIFVAQKKFELFITVCILSNILIMSTETLEQSDDYVTITNIINKIFTSIFLLEGIIKTVALGPRRYINDGWNRFDFLIVAISLPDLFLPAWFKGATVFRIFRVGRLFKLVAGAKGLRTLFNTLLSSLPAILNVGGLLFLLMFVFGVMGMNMFGEMEAMGDHGNFRTFGSALLTLFRVFTGDSWSGILASANNCGGHGGCDKSPVPAVFFISFTVIGSFVMLNLIIGVILDQFISAASSEGLLRTENFFDVLTKKVILDRFLWALKTKMTEMRKGADISDMHERARRRRQELIEMDVLMGKKYSEMLTDVAEDEPKERRKSRKGSVKSN